MCPTPARLAAALALAALGPACGRSSPPPAPAAACVPPPPQPSALPTYAPAAVPATLTQTEAISFGVKAAGDQVAFTVPAGTASVTVVEQAASAAVPLWVSAGSVQVENTPVPINIDVTGVGAIFNDVNMPPSSAFRVLSPSGLTVLDPAAAKLGAYFYSAGSWVGALTLPDTSFAVPGTAGTGVPAGIWTVTVSDWAWECSHYPLGCTAGATPSTYDVTVILKPASAPANRLKVAIYLVGGAGALSGVTAGTATSNPDLQRLQWAVGQFLGGAGITPGFEYHDVPAAVRQTFATGVDANNAGVCGTLGPLLDQAGPGNQLNVFLVDLIKDTAPGSSGFVTVGLDPIVPGPASFGGTPASGVLVSAQDLGWTNPGTTGCASNAVGNVLSLANCGDDQAAAIVSHEAGHFLGLYHTTEYTGTIVDPVGDTLTCFCPPCKTGSAQCQGVGTTDPKVASPYRMLVTDCIAPAGSNPECGGGDNLMFWLLDPSSSKGLLTPGQAAVMRASPLVE